MRSLDGIRSSKFERAVIQPIREHPVWFVFAVLLGLVSIAFLIWASLSTLPPPPLILNRVIPVKVAATLPNALSAAPAVGMPQQLGISAIDVDAAIEQVGLTKTGAMAVPGNTNNAGWFSQGYKPGEAGNAVITGHVDTIWLKPAVFAHIDKLTAGSLITVVDAAGVKRVFAVDQVINYNVNDLPLTEIYGPSLTAHLNLITCSGKWSWKIGSYDQRTVVYTTLVSDPISE